MYWTQFWGVLGGTLFLCVYTWRISDWDFSAHMYPLVYSDVSPFLALLTEYRTNRSVSDGRTDGINVSVAYRHLILHSCRRAMMRVPYGSRHALFGKMFISKKPLRSYYKLIIISLKMFVYQSSVNPRSTGMTVKYHDVRYRPNANDSVFNRSSPAARVRWGKGSSPL